MIPWVAVDVLGGRAVRLTRGREQDLSDYGDAGEALLAWAERGATHLHVVDLDAALGRPSSLAPLLARARRSGLSATVQAAGGIRSETCARRLADAGADRLVVGSFLLEKPREAARLARAFSGGRCVAALDVRGGTVRVRGWLEDTGLPPAQAFRIAADAGFGEALVTDIVGDGTLRGADLRLFESLEGMGLPVLASGGISRARDLRALAAMPWVSGAVVGKALYEGCLELADLEGGPP